MQANAGPHAANPRIEKASRDFILFRFMMPLFLQIKRFRKMDDKFPCIDTAARETHRVQDIFLSSLTLA
ncbi:hypothetical protein AH06_00465 [candidate division TM6 bacterium Zodletone_IIa]|nr:hypothetical protein AH06_00465 [candidate division TM6 bacterium Zodletone_IIa]